MDRHEVLQRAIDYVNSDEARSYELHLCVQKCKLWWPKAPTTESDDGYPVEPNRIPQSCHSVLKAPIGGHRQLVERALLRVTMGVCQINYILRKVLAPATKQGAQRFDDLTYGAMNKMVGGTLATDIFGKLQLSLRPIDKTKYTFGIGLQSAVATDRQRILHRLHGQTTWCKMINCDQGSALC